MHKQVNNKIKLIVDDALPNSEIEYIELGV